MALSDPVPMSKVVLYVLVYGTLIGLVGFFGGWIAGNLNAEKPLECAANNASSISDALNGAQTAESSCPRYGCYQVTREAVFELLSNESSGTGNLFGGDASISIPVKNMDPEGGYFIITIGCQTLNKQSADITSEPIYIGPNQTGTFSLVYGIEARENWKCDNYRVNSSVVKTCELTQLP
ncbi:MAG: hypothetical protein QS98_C0011G0032 [archaeon GW2011_AR3]|nr:MAG: hypothetical protein QS98_C0011G0032 [archaeon GW2011_AR3]MBS3109706.1 hypothetical protein [Candidatus Woesearchaeota archaeon]